MPRITAKNHVSSYRTARSALLAGTPPPTPPYKNTGKTVQIGGNAGRFGWEPEEARSLSFQATWGAPGRSSWSTARSAKLQLVRPWRGRPLLGHERLRAVLVEGAAVEEADALLSSHSVMRTDAVLEAELTDFRPHFDRPVDHELLLTVDIEGLPILVQQFISIDTIYRPPVEWTDGMPNMNWLSTSNEVRWILRDEAGDAENAEIDWRFRLGDVVKIRLRNDAAAFHPMHHPIHLHGQRFLVLSRDGVANRNLAWKDTVLVPVGSAVDLLMEASNPGEWMIHCHIAEHLDAGVMGSFTVVP